MARDSPSSEEGRPSPDGQPGLLRQGAAIGLPVLALVALVAVTYRSALDNGFQFDDRPNITLNAAVHAQRPTPEALWRAASESPLARRPLAYVTFALDWWRGRGEPQVFQQTNLALHALNAVLVFALLVEILGAARGRRDPAVAAAALGGSALWAVHPIQVQAVTYIVQRMATLAAGFTLLSVLLYLRGRRSASRPRAAAWLTASAAAMLAGGVSKENAWITPVLLLVCELAVVRHDRRRIVSPLEGRVLVTVGLAAGALLVATLAGVGPLERVLAPTYEGRPFTMEERLLTQPRVVLFHLSQIFWPLPSRFSLEHDLAISRSPLAPPFTLPAIGLVVVAAAVGLWGLTRRRTRLPALFLLWVPVTLALESSLVGLEMIFEHRMYLPSVGLAGLAGSGFLALGRRGRRTALAAAGVATVLVALLATATARCLPVWRTPVTLAERSVRHAPHSVRAWGSLGQAYLEAGRPEEAENALREALRLEPENRHALEYLGVIRFDAGRLAEAEDLLRRALAQGSASPSLYNHLGEVELARGRVARAERLFRLAIGEREWVGVYHWNRALALEGLGRCDEALGEWRRYLELDDDPVSRRQVESHLESRYRSPGGPCHPLGPGAAASSVLAPAGAPNQASPAWRRK